MRSNEIRKELGEVRLRRERIFGEREKAVARQQLDGDTGGLDERLGNLNRAIENADERIQELEAEYGRFAYIERQANDPRSIEPTDRPLERQDREPRSETRDAALRTLERTSGVMDPGRPEELETLLRQNRDGDLTARSAVGNPGD